MIVSERWDRHWLRMCLLTAEMSKDISTRVGAIVVGPDRALRSTGFNGFPRGVKDTPERIADREMKLRLTVHAERNALLNALLAGSRVQGSVLYLAAQDVATGATWGGAPCTHCAIEIIQAGITGVVSYPMLSAPDRWKADLEFAKGILHEAGLSYREVKP